MKDFVKSEFTPLGEKVDKNNIVFIPNKKGKITSTVGSEGSPYWYKDENQYFEKINGVFK